MELRTDRERCIGAGMCTLIAPDLFDQDLDDGRVVLLGARPSAAERPAAEDAARVCPSGAITVVRPGDAAG